ncbi:uncharacterized protein [Drosophila pseudoobscura]|uniref:RING-type domain-containing protein n=1 Tax=Drosophila pseudoobscura pseudoobscura TaxID=46245 RepID=A0A6I8UKE0_DROPS|nr:uncharacterized protein LOC4816866 [Drosophila pseudoobscura]
MMLYLLVKILNCLDEALLRPLAYVINKFVTGVYYFVWGSYFLGYCLVDGSTRAWHLMIYAGCELQRYYNLLYNNFLDLADYFRGGTRGGLINARDFLPSSALFFLGLLDDMGKVVLWVILLLLDYIQAFLARCLSLFNSFFRISIVVALLLVLYMFRRYVYLLLNYQLQRARTEISEKTQSAYLWTERQLNRISWSDSSEANDGAPPSSGSCVVCRERRTNIVILPCRHLCLCAECSVQVQAHRDTRDHCPLCREFIDGYLQVFV